MYVFAMLIGIFGYVCFSPMLLLGLSVVLELADNSPKDESFEKQVENESQKESRNIMFYASLIALIGITISLLYFDGGYAILGVIGSFGLGLVGTIIGGELSSDSARKKVQERFDIARAEERALEVQKERHRLEAEAETKAIEEKRIATEELREAEEKLKVAQKVEIQKKQEDLNASRIKSAENFFFEFFNIMNFAIQFIDEPNKQNKGFPEISWSFEGLKDQNTAISPDKVNEFNGFLKRQEFSIHIFRNRGTMFRNPRDVASSDAIEIYTHRKMDDYMFIDKEAGMNVTMNYYVYISLRVDNLDFNQSLPVARVEEYDWSTKPIQSDNRHYAYFEFDSHRVTREEFISEIELKKQELEERKEMSRLQEMEEDLIDAEGGAANRLRRAAEKFKKGGLKQSKALDDTEKELLDEFETSGANEEELEKFFEVLRKLRRDIEA